MKKFLLFLLIGLPFFATSQEPVKFYLTDTGNFVSKTGENFIVVPFEGKSSHDIFITLASNIASVYNDPSQVMSTVEDASIKIRAYNDCIFTNKVLMIPRCWAGYYQLEFRIKDGRVRISAPIIENELVNYQLSPTAVGGGNKREFNKVVKGWFKDGKPKEKEQKNIDYVEAGVDVPINSILGIIGINSEIDDNW